MVVNPARAVFGVECRQCNVGEETSLEVQMVLQNIKDLLLFFIKKNIIYNNVTIIFI